MRKADRHTPVLGQCVEHVKSDTHTHTHTHTHTERQRGASGAVHAISVETCLYFKSPFILSTIFNQCSSLQ